MAHMDVWLPQVTRATLSFWPTPSANEFGAIT
jgi:hypothetical protein